MPPAYEEARQFGTATLYRGDCLDVLPTLAPVAAMITDPPYGKHVHTKEWRSKSLAGCGVRGTGSAHGGIDFAHLSEDTAHALMVWAAANVTRWSLMFCDLEGIDLWRRAAMQAGLEYVRSCIWDKVDSSPQFTGDRPANSAEAIVCVHPAGRKAWNGGGRRGVFTCPTNGPNKGSKPHPTTKPLRLMRELVALFTAPGDLVVDPFMGSGTTGIACAQLGRRFVGIELDPRYYEMACERIDRASDQGQLFEPESEPEQMAL